MLSEFIREETAVARAWYGHPFRFMARVLASSVPVDAGDSQNKGHVTFAAPKSLKTANLTIRKGMRLRSRTHPMLVYVVDGVKGDTLCLHLFRQPERKRTLPIGEAGRYLEECDGVRR